MDWVWATLVALLLIIPVVAGDAQTRPLIFNTEHQAQQHCPTDIVVSVNLPNGAYHFKDQGDHLEG